MSRVRLALAVLALAGGCDRKPNSAPQLPWQPHGFRAPTLACEVVVPTGLKQVNPMPDHLVELISTELPPRELFIISERVEDTLAAAVDRVHQFHAGRSPVDQDFEGGTLITVRREDGGFERVALLERDGLPIIEVIGRSSLENGKARVIEVASALKCTRK